jgi:hypothetical protein
VYWVDDYGNPLGTPANPVATTATFSGDIHAEITYPTTPSISNLNIASAATEYSYVFPSNTARFLMRVRGGGSLMRVAYQAGGTGTSWLTVQKGCWYSEGDVTVSAGFAVYVQCDQPAQVVEIVSWAT